jgi:hypothetical protein
MTKTHSPQRFRELAAEGRLLIFQRVAASRERDKRAKPARSAPASPANHANPVQRGVSDPAALAEQIVRAGQRARGELANEIPQATGMPAAIHTAAETARAGGPSLPAPEGLAAQILAAGVKRRRPMGGEQKKDI